MQQQKGLRESEMAVYQGRYSSYERNFGHREGNAQSRNMTTAAGRSITGRQAAQVDGGVMPLYTNSNSKRTSQTGRRPGAYVNGTAAYQYDVVEEIQKKPAKRLSPQTRKNREKAKLMNFGTVFFMAVAMCVAGVVLYGYLALQTANAAAADEIAAMESQLNTLKLENDEEYSRIMSSVNIEEIKTRAIEGLGMQYAQEGQIVEVQGASDDYVRQYQDMP
jgi:cell division protein FtsL